MFKNRGIRFKLTFFILSSCTFIFAVIFSYNYLFSRRIIEGNIESNAKNLVSSTVNKIDAILNAVEKVPESVAYSLEHYPYGRQELMQLLRSVVDGNAEIYGSAIAFEPYAFEKGVLYFAPYFYKSKEGLSFTSIGGEDYNYFDWDWYRLAREEGRPVWTEPYFDKGAGNIIMSTYSVPFYKSTGGVSKFTGVVTADISLSWLRDIISSIKIGRTGYAFLISKSGKIVTHPVPELIMRGYISSLPELAGNPGLTSIASAMIRGGSGYIPFANVSTGRKYWLAYASVPSSGWSLGVVFPRDELMADVTKLNFMVLVLGVAGFLFLLAVIIFISASITRPLRILAGATRNIAAGNLDFALAPAGSKDEPGRLADSFIYMRDALKKYIKDLTEATASREKMENELRIAHEIQMGIIPGVFPPFPGRKEFDIYAVLEPAREVGGDFYDFFFVDEKRLCVVIGDVSDKGVPAALFMSLAKSLIKAFAKEGAGPGAVLERVNNEICGENDSLMFVTVFLGILDTHSGKFIYVNAGHNPPLLVRGGGKPQFMSDAASMAVGLKEEAAFKEEEMLLAAGESLILYTDGASEAFNEKGEQFTAEALRNKLSLLQAGPIREVVTKLMAEVKVFSKGAAQADDITIMGLRYLGENAAQFASGQNKVNFVLKNELSQLEELAGNIKRFAKSFNLPEEITHDLTVSLEEIVSNTIKYGYKDKLPRQIEVEIEHCGQLVKAKVCDNAAAFNPLEAPPARLDKTPDRREPGGLGIHIVRKLMDKVEYKRQGEKNILLISKKITAP